MQSRLLRHAEVLLAFSLMISSCSQVKSSDPSPGNQPRGCARPGMWLSLNAGRKIPQNEIPPLEEAALRGSGSSALKLADFYQCIEDDWDKGSYWTTISAEDGEPVGMDNLAYLLRYGKGAVAKSDRKNEIRARFWLERSAEAKDELRRMGNKGL